MTEAEVRGYLNRAYRAREMVGSMQEELLRLQELAKQIKEFSVSPENSKRLLGQIVEREQKQQGRIAEYLEAAEEVQQVVEELDNADYRAILHLRYLNFKTWDEIADTLHFSNVWIFHLHKRALSAAGSVIQRREQAACMG